jgi:hypothetical protein
MSSWLILNEAATWERVRATVLAAARPLKRGDLLVLSVSSHGGQVADYEGDEADGLDETVCLFDGAVRDDLILELLYELPPGLRVAIASDECHAEGNFRALGRWVQRGVSLGHWGRAEPRLRLKPRATWDGQLIQLAGCHEAGSSMGGASGGVWTLALKAALKPGVTWRGWFDAAVGRMPGSQAPVWVEYGAVADGFRNGPAFE